MADKNESIVKDTVIYCNDVLIINVGVTLSVTQTGVTC